MHCKMNCMGGNESHVEGTDSRPMNPAQVHQEQSHLMALTSEWGHSVFELHGPRENAGYNLIKHPAPFPYKASIHGEHNAGGMMHNTEAASYMSPMYSHKQDSHTNYTIPEPQCHLQDDIKQETEERNFGGAYVAPKTGRPAQESPPEEARPYSNPELPKANEFCQEEQSKPQSPDQDPASPSDRKLRCKRSRLSEEEILARRAALATAQRDVRRRRRDKMSQEELQDKLAALAASQRESRRKQREKMTEEELHLRRTISAITQREIRKRRLSSMSEDELKDYRSREASRQKELRHKKRSEMTEEELKSVKAREAALSAARRTRRLGLDKGCKTSDFIGQEPDPSPS